MKTATTGKIATLEATKARIAAQLVKVNNDLTTQRNAQLLKLPGQLGFDDLNSFIRAVKSASGVNGSAKASTGTNGKRHRAVITDDTRAKVKEMVKSEKTGAEIAKTLGISLPSVQNIKKALGLVNERK